MAARPQNIFLPARKLGWPQDEVSLVSGNERHRRRRRVNTGLSNTLNGAVAIFARSSVEWPGRVALRAAGAIATGRPAEPGQRPSPERWRFGWRVTTRLVAAGVRVDDSDRLNGTPITDVHPAAKDPERTRHQLRDL
jgi:hypothetical protein